jgi:hypothetical protein
VIEEKAACCGQIEPRKFKSIQFVGEKEKHEGQEGSRGRLGVKTYSDARIWRLKPQLWRAQGRPAPTGEKKNMKGRKGHEENWGKKHFLTQESGG